MPGKLMTSCAMLTSWLWLIGYCCCPRGMCNLLSNWNSNSHQYFEVCLPWLCYTAVAGFCLFMHIYLHMCKRVQQTRSVDQSYWFTVIILYTVVSLGKIRCKNLARLFCVSWSVKEGWARGAAEPFSFHNLSPHKYVMLTYLAPKILVASSASAGGVEMLIQVLGLVRHNITPV